MATADYPRDAMLPPDAPAAGVVLRRNLDRLMVRRNQQRMVKALAAALTWGVGVSALGVLAYRLYIIDGEWWQPLVIIAVSLVIGYRNGLLQRSGPFDAALDADRSLGLQDRLSSALAFVQPELVQRVRPERPQGLWPRLRALLFPHLSYVTAPHGASTELVPALVHDAAQRSAKLNPRELYPAKVDRTVQLLLAFSLLLAIFAFMPNIEWLRSAEQRKVAATLQGEGKKLEAMAKLIENKKDISQDAEAKKLAKKLDNLARKMQRGRMTKKAVLVEMGQLRKDMEKAAKNDSGQNLSNMDQMEQALREQQMETPEGQQLQENLKRGEHEKAAQQIEKLAEKLEKNDLKPEEREKAANDLQKAAQALRRQGGEENEAAAKQLEQAAESLRQQNKQGNQQGQQKNQQGQQQNGQNGQKSQQQNGQNGQAKAGADALRKMASGLRQSAGKSGNSQALRDMLNKIAQSEKDTGQNSGQPSDAGEVNLKSGDGSQCPGGNCPPGLTPGKDLMPSTTGPTGGAGLGPRSGNQPHSSGGGVSKQKSNRTGDKRRWMDDWANRLPKTQKNVSRINGKWGKEGETEQLQTRGEAQNGPVKTPYYEVYESYKKDAEDAISKEVVPPAYKQPVKDYFDSLKPEKP